MNKRFLLLIILTGIIFLGISNFISANMWTPDQGGSLYKVLPNGTVISYSGSSNLSYSHGIVYDGNGSLWIIGHDNGLLTKFNLSSTIFNSYTMPTVDCVSIAYGGGFVWAGCANNHLYQVFPNNGSTIDKGYFNLTGAYNLYGLAWSPTENALFAQYFGNGIGSFGLTVAKIYLNGTSIMNWAQAAAGEFGNEGITIGKNGYIWTTMRNAKVVKIDPITPNTTTVYSGTGNFPGFLAYDGNNSMWTPSESSNVISKIDVDTGAITNYTGIGSDAVGISYDNSSSMWVASRGSNLVTRVWVNNGTMINYTGVSTAHGIASDVYTLPVPSPAPTPPGAISIVLNNPADNKNISTSSIIFSVTPQDTNNATGLKVWLYSNWTGTWKVNVTNLSALNNTQTNFTINNIPEGKYIWNAIVGDGANNATATSNFTFTKDTIIPLVRVSYPNLTLSFFERYNNISVNWSANDTNIQNCWIDYDSVNRTVTCNSNSTTINITSGTVKNLNFYVNDSAGNLNVSSVSWNYKLFLNYEIYTPSITEGISNTFYQNFLTNGTDISAAKLIYNSTNYTGTLNNHGGNNFTVSATITSPSTSSNVNLTFYWNITQGSVISSIRSSNQTVLNFAADNCSINKVVIYNFTITDEKSLLQLTAAGNNTLGKVDVNIRSFGSSTEITSFNSSYSQINPFGICINSTLGSSNSYNIDALVEYSATNYQTEFYNIQNETLNSTTMNQNISLYDLNTSTAQAFKLIVKDSSFLALDDALIKIYRKYIDEGIYRIIEIPKTDGNGETTASLVLNDVIYKFVIVKYGETIKTFDNVRAICQTPLVSTCTIDFNAFASGITVPDYEEGEDFNYTLGYNSSSRIISSQFDIPSGTQANITLIVINEDTLGTSVCTDSLTSTSGTLTCTVPSNFGNATILAKIYRNGNLQAQGQVKLDQLPSDIYSGILVILGMFLIMILIGVGLSDNPVFTVIFLLVGVILLTALNLIANNGFIGGTATILFLIVAIILILIKGARRN